MPRSTIGLLAIVLCGCLPETEPSEYDSDVAARRHGGDGHAPWVHPQKGRGWHHQDHDDWSHDDGHNDAPTVDDLARCVDACVEGQEHDDDDDDCGDDDHHGWWRTGGSHADSPEECQALWDGLDDSQRSTALADLGDALAECGVETPPPQPGCESFTAEDDWFYFYLPRDENFVAIPSDVTFDVFAGDGYSGVDSVLPEGAGMGMEVIADTTDVTGRDIALDADGAGTWYAAPSGDMTTFTYTACCVEPGTGEVNMDACDSATVTLLAC